MKKHKVFISYSSDDIEYLRTVKSALSLLVRHERIEILYDAQIAAGEKWNDEIRNYISASSVILLLISRSFVASDFCFNIEMKFALQKHRDGEAVVIPVLIRQYNFGSITELSGIQAIPKDGAGQLKGVSSWQDPEEAYATIHREIERKLDKLDLSLNKQPKIYNMFEIELLIFILDGSGSMRDGKADLLEELVRNLLKRLKASSTSSAYRIALVYFAVRSSVEQNNGSIYLDIDTALEKLENPYKKLLGSVYNSSNTTLVNSLVGRTNLYPALSETLTILNNFQNDESLPADKRASVFLFTDGYFHDQDPSRKLIDQIHAHSVSPTIATIAFGKEAESSVDLLIEMASETSDRQKRHLAIAQVIGHLPNENKLFLRGHDEDRITDKKVEAIRNFLNTLTQTT